MAKLKQIWDQLALSAYLSANEAARYVFALRDAGLIPRGRPGREGSAEATPESAAWLVLALLCGPWAKRAVERAQEVAQFRNYRPSVISFTASDGRSDHRQPFIPADPGATFLDALTTLIAAQSGRPEPVLPRVMVSDIPGDRFAAITYVMREPIPFEIPGYGPGCRPPDWDFYFTANAEAGINADPGKLQRVSAFTPEALASVTRLLGPEHEPNQPACGERAEAA
jgi:hypothetical protein